MTTPSLADVSPRLIRRKRLLGCLLGLLLAHGNSGLDADAAKHETDAEVLHLAEAVAKGKDGQHHGHHLARHRHRDEQDGREGRERVD